MKNVITTTPTEIEVLARSKNNAIHLRTFALDLVGQVNRAHQLMEIMDEFISSYLNDMTVMTLKYRLGMKLPCVVHLDEYVVVKHPAHLVKWKVDFYKKFGNCYMWRVDPERYGVSPDEFESDMNEKYWSKYGKYMEAKNRTITNFNKQK
jgi:hypothetical protein